MSDKDAIIAGQAALIGTLTRRGAELELLVARLSKDSSNSSKPPSSDVVKPPAKARSAGRRPGGNKRGGQPGHRRSLREPLPPERVDEQLTYEVDDADVRRLG